MRALRIIWKRTRIPPLSFCKWHVSSGSGAAILSLRNATTRGFHLTLFALALPLSQAPAAAQAALAANNGDLAAAVHSLTSG